jgi:heterodisulfide reductase subunit C
MSKKSTKKAPEKVSFDDLDPGFADEVASMPGGEHIKRCYACGTCAAGCPVTSIDETYNCRNIIRQVLMGMREQVLKSPTIWFCVLCHRCQARCPQEVNFTDIMRVLRHIAVRDGYAPAELLSNSEEFNRLAYLVRRDMIKNTVEGRKEVVEKIKAKIASK